MQAKRKTKIPTTEDILKQQEAQAKTAKENALTVPAGANALVADSSNPWSETATAIDRVLGLPRLKFDRNGEYVVGDTETIPKGTRAIAHCSEMELGFVRWEDGQPVDRRWGRIADKFLPPALSDLPDNEPRKQPDESAPKRPWQFGMELPLVLLVAGNPTYCFGASSKGGLGALRGLSRAYGQRLEEGKSGEPIVELRGDKYWHSGFRSWVQYPILHVVGWTGADGKPLSIADDLNDKIDI